jgi:MFS family permease
MVMSGFTPAALAYLADMTEAHTQDRGAIMGLYSVFLGIGQLIGSLLGGPFAQAAAIDGVIAVTAILAAIAWGTVIALRRNGDLVPARGALPIE